MKKVFVFIAVLLLASILETGASAVAIAEVREILPADTARYGECAMGDLTADAVRSTCGTDAAVVHGGVFASNLQSGALSEEDLPLYFVEDPEICTVSFCAAELYALMENSVSHVVQRDTGDIDGENSEFDGYLQISGISVIWDLSAPVGERIVRITDGNDQVLDRGDEMTMLTLAAPREILDGNYGYTAVESSRIGDTGLTLWQCMSAYGRKLGEWPAPESGRVYVRAANQNRIIDRFPLSLILGVTVLALLFNAPKFLEIQKKSGR